MKGKKMVVTLLSVFGVLGLAGLGILNLPQFGKIPSGERLTRIEKSPNYKNGHFVNKEPTETMTGDKNMFTSMKDFMFTDRSNAMPDSGQVKTVKTNLSKLDMNQDLVVWFGHSSYLLQLSGKKFLIDPVFYAGAPFKKFCKQFRGTDVYKPKDMPDIDVLVISHDHYDHLDYKTVTEMEPRISRVVSGLGVGSHFEYWGYANEKLLELDWNDTLDLGDGFKIYCLPARHFSGRSIFQAKTLWASFIIEAPSGKRVFVGGDGGYDSRFKLIGKKFPGITFAILENGQYNQDWRQIHTMPEELPKVIDDLGAWQYMTVHHSKFVLSYHAWDEPVKTAKKLKESGVNMLIPTIGEVVKISEVKK